MPPRLREGRKGMPEDSDAKIIAIPSSNKGGLDDKCCIHFGRSPTITVVKVTAKDIEELQVVKNPGSRSGECMKIIGVLKSMGVSSLIVGGIGRTAFKICNDLGIDVYQGLEDVTVRASAERFMKEGYSPLTPDDVCNKMMD